MTDEQAERLLLLLDRIADALERQTEVFVREHDRGIADEVARRLKQGEAQQDNNWSATPGDSYYGRGGWSGY